MQTDSIEKWELKGDLPFLKLFQRKKYLKLKKSTSGQEQQEQAKDFSNKKTKNSTTYLPSAEPQTTAAKPYPIPKMQKLPSK